MKALTIEINTNTINEIDIQMQANSVYTFFNSILTDELFTLKDHVIYTDSNALSDAKEAYFIGEQLLLGDALIVSRNDFNDSDVKIKKDELSLLLKTEMSDFYKEALSLLSQTDMTLYKTFDITKNNETISLNLEWTLYTFNIADDATKSYFLSELQKEIKTETNIEQFIIKLSQLAVNAI